jgi:hypothetical protein
VTDDEPVEDEEYRDELPEDLDAGYVGAYTFPDNDRRRIPGIIYLVMGGGAVLLVALAGTDAVLVNTGLAVGGVGLCLLGLYCLWVGRPLGLDETDALAAASREVGFPVGHASAQLGWRGLRSIPTWRILLYSADEPPTKRGLVLVDGLDGQIVDTILEDNPEDWSQLQP